MNNTTEKIRMFQSSSPSQWRRNAEKRLAVSLGMAILDNWFELNGVDYQDIRNQIFPI